MSERDFDDWRIHLEYLTQKEGMEVLNEKLALTRGQRVRAAMFPETLEKTADNELPSFVQSDPSRPSALQRLSEPSQDMKKAIAGLVNYQIDVDFAMKFVPEITKLLGDSDPDVVRNAAELTHDLSLSEAACFVMNKSPNMVHAIVKAVGAAGTSGEQKKMKEAATGALFNLSFYGDGRLTIFKTGGIPLLVRLLGSPAEKVVFFAISTLHNLMQFQEGAKSAVRAAGGIQKMVPLLRSRDPKFLSVNVDCLQLLAYGDQDSKLAIWNSKGPKELTKILDKSKDEKLVWTTSRLLKVLSTCPNNKASLVEAGGFMVLSSKLGSTTEEKLAHNYLTTMRNLSDTETKFRWEDSLLSQFLNFLTHPDPDVVLYASGIIGNLTAERPDVKRSLFRLGGLVPILKALVQTRESKTMNKDETAEELLRSLRHMTSEADLAAAEVQKELRGLGGLELVSQFLHLAVSWPMVKEVTGLVRNLVNFQDNQDTLVELKAIPRLAQILGMAVKEDKKSDRDLGYPSKNIDGVNMSDIIETSLGALWLLAEASMINRDLIAELRIVPLLNRLLEEAVLEDEAVEQVCKKLLKALQIKDDDDERESQRGSIIRRSSSRRKEENFYENINDSSKGIYTVVDELDRGAGDTGLTVRDDDDNFRDSIRSKRSTSSGSTTRSPPPQTPQTPQQQPTEWLDSEV